MLPVVREFSFPISPNQGRDAFDGIPAWHMDFMRLLSSEKF
jgi:hypothetical protein